MLGIIIQARLGSTRLPNKMILPFYEDKGVFEVLIKKLKISFPIMPIILATSTNPIDDVLVNICKKHSINFYRGSETNVLQRFIDTAKQYNITKIIRICADNPFLDIQGIKNLVLKFEAISDLDYCSFKTSKGTPSILTHYGFWAEAVNLKALLRVNDRTDNTHYLEHVTNFIYSNPELFKLDFLPIPKEIEKKINIRMTLDTESDFILLKEIYKESLNNNLTKIDDIVNYVSENDIWTEKMKQQIEKNTK